MRKKGHEKHENHERWLVSYADFITLLFAFFVVMYAVSSVNEGKYRVLSDSMAVAFRAVSISVQPIQWGGLAGNPPAQPDFGRPERAQVIAPDLRPMPTAIVQRLQRGFLTDRPQQFYPPSDTATEPKQATSKHEPSNPEDPLDQLVERLRDALPELIRADVVQVRRHSQWVEIEIKNSILFASGSAVVNQQALEALKDIAVILRDIHNRIRVEGFTDDVPINTAVYPSNWELSAARAASVVHLLMQYGVRPERMAAVGYGEYQPIDDNATDQGRIRNRRVVLVILGDKDILQQMNVNAEMKPSATAARVRPGSAKAAQ